MRLHKVLIKLSCMGIDINILCQSLVCNLHYGHIYQGNTVYLKFSKIQLIFNKKRKVYKKCQPFQSV